MGSSLIVNGKGRRHIANSKNLIWEEYGGACAVLVQWFGCNRASVWQQGAVVKGNTGVAIGTCIATFENGKYPNRATGNHAAVYMGQDAQGIHVLEQWKSLPRPQYRVIKFKDDMDDPSNNGNCFSVILTTPFKAAPGFKKGFVAIGTNPATTPDSARVINAITSQRYDVSVVNAIRKALRDEVLTFNDVKAIITSAQDHKSYNRAEIRAFKILLKRAITLDEKSKTLLRQTLRSIR